MFSEDTIAAISTPPGYSGIGIVRMSGAESIRIAEEVFRPNRSRKLTETLSHRIIYGHLIHPTDGQVIDEVLLSVMKSPHTFTREDMVEINCHGGPVALRRTLEVLLDAGARLAQPGEFTKRAFLNGRIDLAQAEAVLDIINSLTEEGNRAAIEQLGGGLSERMEAMRQALIELIAVVEASIDFPEEGIEPPTMEELNRKASEVLNELEQMIDQARYGRILREGLRTAIIGRPNVGKSSILNALVAHDRVIVTDVPGTTRDVIEEYLNIDGIPIRIMDTAGIREAKDLAEKEGVERSLRAMKEADLTLLVIDGSEELHETDRALMERCKGVQAVIVLNKNDLPPGVSSDRFTGRLTVRISALKKSGIEELKRVMKDVSLKERRGDETALVTNVRHVRALKEAKTAVASFLHGLTELPPELLSVDLREALEAIGEITGDTTTDEILDRIFSDFCIGK